MINIVVIKSLIGILQILLLVLTISALIIFIIQFFRWLYGFLFAPKFRISIFRVIVPLFLSFVLFLVIGYVDYLIRDVWQVMIP